MDARVVVVGSDGFSRAAAGQLAGWIGQAVSGRGRCRLALAGGSTPAPVYGELARLPVATSTWHGVHVFFGDERAVPPDHPDSNYAMARSRLLDRVAIPAEQVHRMEAERADREVAAAEYSRLLEEPLDVLILGMGPDGHTASLFPGSPALGERRKRVVPVVGPKPPPQRLTITPPVISEARTVLVLATGADKADMVARALGPATSPRAVPATLARHGTWILDPAAAAGLAKAPA